MKISNGFTKLSEIASKVEEKIANAKLKHSEKVLNKKIDKCTKTAEKLGLTIVDND